MGWLVQVFSFDEAFINCCPVGHTFTILDESFNTLISGMTEPQDGAPARQKPLAAHTDRLNAQFCKPRWLEGARAQELSAALDARRGEVEHRCCPVFH